jgi:hypothetical protein
MAEKNGTDKDFLLNNYNSRRNEGHLYHAMTLSFYYLLRYKEEKDVIRIDNKEKEKNL